jgi:hypothetical protein
MSEAVAKAKDTLLRALEQLEQAEGDLEHPPDRVDLIVVYSIGREMPEDDGSWHEVGGWTSTAGPTWMHGAMLRRCADAFDAPAFAAHDEPDEADDGDGD